MTITEFLKARLDEDEAAALAWPEDERGWKPVGNRNLRYGSGRSEQVGAVDVSGRVLDWWERIYVRRDIDGLTGHIARHDPARVLRDVAAKRAILEMHTWTASLDGCWSCSGDHGADPTPAPCGTLRHLAAVYAVHPDYNTKWAP